MTMIILKVAFKIISCLLLSHTLIYFSNPNVFYNIRSSHSYSLLRFGEVYYMLKQVRLNRCFGTGIYSSRDPYLIILYMMNIYSGFRQVFYGRIESVKSILTVLKQREFLMVCGSVVMNRFIS